MSLSVWQAAPELAPEVKGLLHNSEYSHNPNDNFQASVKIGDMVEVAIESVKAVLPPEELVPGYGEYIDKEQAANEEKTETGADLI